MSIEIIEENNVSSEPGLFLPPTVLAVRRSGRSVLSIVSAAFFLSAALLLGICDLAAGVFAVPIGIMLLVSSVVCFCAAGKPNGGFGLRSQKNVCLISAILWAILTAAVLLTANGVLPLVSVKAIDNAVSGLPSPLNSTVDHGLPDAKVITASLTLCFLSLGLSFGSLNRSRRKNLPFTKTVFFSFVINLLLSAVLVCDGLSRLYIIPSVCLYDRAYTGLETAQSVDAGICFCFALAVLLSAVNLLVIYIRMRKVRNVILKAQV